MDGRTARLVALQRELSPCALCPGLSPHRKFPRLPSRGEIARSVGAPAPQRGSTELALPGCAVAPESHGTGRNRLLLVGIAPGGGSIRNGAPFTGPAGVLLRAAFREAGLPLGRGLEEVFYLTDAVKCLPPGNRTPRASELHTCWHRLERELAVLEPRLIVTFGEPAARAFLDPGVRLSEVWGEPQSWRGIPLLPFLHPSPRNRRALRGAGLNPDGYRKFLARVFRRFLEGYVRNP